MGVPRHKNLSGDLLFAIPTRADTMGKFPIADQALLQTWICRRCKARNARGAERCRKCFSTFLRPKRARRKEAKGK
jgi:large subunit ribosomal protein L40e